MKAEVSMRGNRASVTQLSFHCRLPLGSRCPLTVMVTSSWASSSGLACVSGLSRVWVFSAERIQREAEGQEGQRLVSVGHWAGHCHQSWVGYIVYNVEEVGKGKKTIFLLILE